MSALLDAALEYGKRGWYVFPCRGKRPYTVNGHKNATSEVKEIARLWATYPDANIGLSLRTSGLLAIDVDPRNGGTEQLAQIEAKYGPLPRACHQRSGGGGEHFVMRDPGCQIRGSVTDGAPLSGLDVKCNGYILVSPSVHPETKELYRWISQGDPASIPDAWLPLVKKAVGSEAEDGLNPGWRESIGALYREQDLYLRQRLQELGPRGAGNGTTFQAIRLVHHDMGLSVEDGRAYLNWWNEGSGTPHSDRDLDRQTARVSRKADQPPDDLTGSERKQWVRGHCRGWMRAMPALEAAVQRLLEKRNVAGDSFATELDRARREVEAALGTAEDGDVQAPLFESALHLLRREYPPTPWLVEGLITQGGTAVIATEPKSAKTWLATEIALAVASGTPVFGEIKTGSPRSVAYFYAEDLGSSVQNRLRALCAGRGMAPEEAVKRLNVQPRGRSLDVKRSTDLALIVASCRRFGHIELLVLDPLRDIHSGNEDKSDDMAPVMRHLRVVGDLLNCTVLFVHHTAKFSANSAKRRSGQSMRGSSAIHGSIDSGIYLSDLDGDGVSVFTNRVLSEVKGARSTEAFELTLQIEDGDDGTAVRASWSTAEIVDDDDDEDFRNAERRKQIIESVRTATTPLSKNKIRERDGKTWVKGAKGAVLAVIAVLVTEGVLKMDKRSLISMGDVP